MVKTEVLREIQNDVEICVLLPRRLVVACYSERATSRLPAHAALQCFSTATLGAEFEIQDPGSVHKSI